MSTSTAPTWTVNTEIVFTIAHEPEPDSWRWIAQADDDGATHTAHGPTPLSALMNVIEHLSYWEHIAAQEDPR